MQLFERAAIEACVGLDQSALAVVEQAFAALARGEVEMPPVLSLALPDRNGEVDVKTAYMRGLDQFAIKVSPGFFDNPARGLPSLNGLMILFSAETGLVNAILLDRGYLTAVRTALAGAVAARHLANADARIVAVLGAGEQARLQARALKLVRDIRELRVWARNPTRAQAYAEAMSPEFATVTVYSQIPEALAGADIVVTATPATAPLIDAAMVLPGMHVTAMGSDQAGKQELAYDVLLSADTVVVDRRQQSEYLGELQHRPTDASLPRRLYELGDIIEGNARGRSRHSEITVCDLTGTGVQDTAIADYAWRRLTVSG